MVLGSSTIRLDDLGEDGGLFCGGQNGRQIAEAGLAILSPFLLAGSRYSRDPADIIISPSPHDEPLGYVAVGQKNES